MKRLLLIAGNFAPEKTGIGKYNGEMIAWFAAQGIATTVITTYPYYPQWQIASPYKKRSYRYSTENKKTNSAAIHIIRCPHYVPQKPSGVKRMISDLSILFFVSFPLLASLFKKNYDAVMVVSPPLLTGILGVVYKKIKGAKFLYHMQDLQVDAAQEMHIIRSKKIIQLLFWYEKILLKNADLISTISAGMIHKVKAKTGKPVFYFPNWTDTQLFYPIKERGTLKQQFGFLATDILLLYSGAIGEKQGLEILVPTAIRFTPFNNVKFIICGEGPYKHALQHLVKKEDLANIFFMDLQPAEKLNEFLNMADVHLVIQKMQAGDLVLPSKLANILSVGGLAIVTANQNTSLYDIIHNNTIGIAAIPENSTSLIECISDAITNDHTAIKENARRYAGAYLSKEIVLSQYLSCIQ